MKNKEEQNIKHLKRSLAKYMVKRDRINRDSKYGQFIIQTNEVQFYLISIISLRVFQYNKEFGEYLEGLTLGSLINCFRICVKNPDELSLINSLKSYNKSRIALAHKMYTKKALTEKDCESSIKLGEKLLIKLKNLIK